MLGGERAGAKDQLAEGETLVLYTDGLIERRTASLDAGLDRLPAAALHGRPDIRALRTRSVTAWSTGRRRTTTFAC